ncbi:hypothetical protein AMTRI_Chr09g35600 [Amborella trichopoda]|uniref:Uncharacterized protein n=1 Tax=Amborella trichopoda TaxID=13333 RepID=W1NMB1_AMBTC|nr:hypothetical protein AMTR_s00001p00234020 [Amborella trichopoda]
MASPDPYCIRSVSMPTGSHPILSQVKEQVHQLSCEHMNSSSSEWFIGNLRNLYNDLDDLLRLPLAQHVLCKCKDEVEELVEDSLSLLDACDKMRGVVAKVREQQQGILSTIRRRDHFGLDELVSIYIRSRKKMTKDLTRCLGTIATMSKCIPSDGQNHQSIARDCQVMDVLRLARSVTVSYCHTLITGLARGSNRWSLISKFLRMRPLESGHVETCELEHLDMILWPLHACSSKLKEACSQDALRLLDSVEDRLGSIEEQLGCLCNLLIRMRVTLLNILTN